MDNYIDMSHGMELNPDEIENHRENENGIHFLTLYYILSFLNDKLTQKDLDIFSQIVDNITSYGADGNKIHGLYDRGAGESLGEDKESIRTISHDNLNAIACFSKAFGLIFHEDIVKYGNSHMWRFDNVYPENPRVARTMHPRDIIFWSFLAKKWWAKVFIWEPLLECILTCCKTYDIKPKLHERIWYWFTRKEYTPWKQISTSGKLLAFTRLFALRKTWYGRLTWKICTGFIDKHFEDGWKTCFDIYFQNPNHPIRKEIAELYDKNKGLFNA